MHMHFFYLEVGYSCTYYMGKITSASFSFSNVEFTPKGFKEGFFFFLKKIPNSDSITV